MDPSTREDRGAWRAALRCVIAVVLLLNGCARLQAPKAGPGEQPFDEIRSAPYASADPLLRSVTRLPPFSHRPQWPWLAKLAPPRRLPPVTLIDPDLSTALRGAPGTTPETVVVTFRDHVALPRFPHLDPTRPRS